MSVCARGVEGRKEGVDVCVSVASGRMMKERERERERERKRERRKKESPIPLSEAKEGRKEGRVCVASERMR